MGTFAFQNAYPDPDDGSANNSDNEEVGDFEIDSDASDAELLELKQELSRLKPEKAKRDLADATVAAQEMTLQRWKRFSEFVRKDPLKLLKSCSVSAFKGYLIWYHNTHPRAKRLNTYESVWKTLRQLYYDTCRKVVEKDIGVEITNYLHGQFCNERGLVRGMKAKHVIGHNGLHGALYYHWKFDTEVFTLELERIQLAAGSLFLAYTGARPGAIFESGCKGIAGTNAALLYGHVKLRLLRPPEKAPLLVLEVTILLDKGKRKRNQPQILLRSQVDCESINTYSRKTITLYENHTCPAMCPILHFIAIAFADNAFHPKLVAAGLTPRTLHSFTPPEGRITIDFVFRNDILETPVFRRTMSSMKGVQVDPVRALSANSISYWMKRLGERAGFEHPLQPYALRREVGTELTDRGVSDQQRNQILGHAKSETFLKHYISSNVVVDVQATFLGETSKSDLIKEIGKLCLRRDPNLPKRLSDEQRLQVHALPTVVSAQTHLEDLKKRLENGFGSISKGSKSPDGIKYARIRNKVRALKLRLERDTFIKVLRDFHSTADLDHMVNQLNGQEPPSTILAPIPHVLGERTQLAHDLFEPATESSFAEMADLMTRLCLRSEGKDRRNRDTFKTDPGPSTCARIPPLTFIEPLQIANVDSTIPLSTIRSTEEATTAGISPRLTADPVARKKRSPTSLMCLFCSSNPKRGRTQSFRRSDSLRRHYRQVHFQYQVGPFPCPVPSCSKIINDSSYFANHAVVVHKSDLGVRADIMKAQRRIVKPGQLLTFVL
ncbi:hypothetical protein MMC13_001789 [Lambiella insularis]|nr:hypothetical protein [Lambiella insularis]